jgi:hypothetical protein
MQAIRDYMTDGWIDGSVIPKVREGRYLSRALISPTTGITPALGGRDPDAIPDRVPHRHHGRPALRVAIRKNQGERADNRIVWARGHDVWPVLTDMRALLAWIAANATDGYRQNNPMDYLFCRQATASSHVS